MSSLRTIGAFLVGVGLIVLAAPGNANADAARGGLLSEQSCSQCHGVRPDQASTNPKAPTFSVIAAEPSVTAISLRVFLRTPHATMPNIMLKPDDTDDIIDYLLSLKPRR